MPGLQEQEEEEEEELLVTLVSSDGVEFVVPETVALKSPTIEQLIGDQMRVSLPSIRSNILGKVIEFAEKLVDSRAAAAAAAAAAVADDEAATVDLSWAKELVHVASTILASLIVAADHLGIEELLHEACEHAAELMSGRTPEEVQKLFSLKCDLTPEEEAEIRDKNKWAFE